MKNAIWTAFIKPFVRVAPSKSPQRLLVVTTTGVGDTIWATPGIRALKLRYPRASISVMTRPVGRQILTGSPYIDEFILIPERPLAEFPKLLKELRAKKFDAVYIFHASQRPIFPLCALLNVPVHGTAGECKGLDWTLSHPAKKRHCHEIERRLDLTGDDNLADHTLDFFLTDEERQQARERLKDLPRPIIAFQPFAKDGFKHWPEKSYIESACKLPGTKLITGSPDEAVRLRPIADAIDGGRLLAGALSLREIAAVLEQVDLFITGDTGPMHIAFACKTPTLALFGPTDPALCGPHHAKRAEVLRAMPTCTPCLRRGCAVPFCMRQISTQQVVEKALEMLG